MKFGVGDLHFLPLSTSFVKIGSITDILLLNGVKEIFPYILHFSSDLYKIGYRRFQKNWSGDGDFLSNRYCDV